MSESCEKQTSLAAIKRGYSRPLRTTSDLRVIKDQKKGGQAVGKKYQRQWTGQERQRRRYHVKQLRMHANFIHPKTLPRQMKKQTARVTGPLFK
ncbi:hypothetical protein OAG34_00975 [bacterium]|nr:hypothetical protein [bacterium]